LNAILDIIAMRSISFVPIRFLGIEDVFVIESQSGTVEELQKIRSKNIEVYLTLRELIIKTPPLVNS